MNTIPKLNKLKNGQMYIKIYSCEKCEMEPPLMEFKSVHIIQGSVGPLTIQLIFISLIIKHESSWQERTI